MLINSLDQIVQKTLAWSGAKAFRWRVCIRTALMFPQQCALQRMLISSLSVLPGLPPAFRWRLTARILKTCGGKKSGMRPCGSGTCFLRAPFPEKLDAALRGRLAPLFQDRAVAVRSTAPGEDDQGASFAGLHDSYVNVRGIDAIMDHVRLVWASLWSDAALLYRQEIGLSVIRSKMAVVVQEMIDGDRSGVIFTRNPANDRQSVIESVHGLNQGLVDGIVAPDRWILDLATRQNTISYAGGPKKVDGCRSSRGCSPGFAAG